MTIYNYLNHEVRDIINYIKENRIDVNQYNDDQLIEMLFNEDSITGNGSSSYTFNTYKAECNLVGNWSLLKEALAITKLDSINILKKGPEWCDVIIRCYLLDKAVVKAREEL